MQVLHEALRLCPPAAAIARMAMQDLAVDGYRVMSFDPDRFGPEQATSIDRWQYLPFGAGPRSCIGDHFAMLEATLALATIIRNVEVVSLHKDFPLAVPFTMVAAEAVPARIRRRTTG